MARVSRIAEFSLFYFDFPSFTGSLAEIVAKWICTNDISVSMLCKPNKKDKDETKDENMEEEEIPETNENEEEFNQILRGIYILLYFSYI